MSSANASRARSTALFIILALTGAYLLGAAQVLRPDRVWLTQFRMWMPGLAGLAVMALRREPPRLMGFAFARPAAWLAAFAYPFGVIAACVALAYLLRRISGSDVIHFQPATVRMEVYGVTATGMALVPLRLARNLVLMSPWLVVALCYRWALPEKLGAGASVARAGLWAGVMLIHPAPWWRPVGSIGEELGWRGWLVRTWRDRPLTALGLSASAWALYHVPVVVREAPLHAFLPALSFLLSIAAAAAAFQALYLWSGSVWPPIVAHYTWNFWNPFFLGNQYGPSKSIFGGMLWLINGEGVLGMLINGALTVVLIQRWRRQVSILPPRV
jgi:membrane protease YdiL (CAAX protease family)